MMSDKISFVVKQTWKNNLKKLLTRKKFDDKIKKSLEGDKVKNGLWKLNRINKLRTSNSFISKFFEIRD